MFLFTTFINSGVENVHRWIAIGPIKVHVKLLCTYYNNKFVEIATKQKLVVFNYCYMCFRNTCF